MDYNVVIIAASELNSRLLSTSRLLCSGPLHHEWNFSRKISLLWNNPKKGIFFTFFNHFEMFLEGHCKFSKNPVLNQFRLTICRPKLIKILFLNVCIFFHIVPHKSVPLHDIQALTLLQRMSKHKKKCNLFFNLFVKIQVKYIWKKI